MSFIWAATLRQTPIKVRMSSADNSAEGGVNVAAGVDAGGTTGAVGPVGARGGELRITVGGGALNRSCAGR
jgi:hypothetical protein